MRRIVKTQHTKIYDKQETTQKQRLKTVSAFLMQKNKGAYYGNSRKNINSKGKSSTMFFNLAGTATVISLSADITFVRSDYIVSHKCSFVKSESAF